MAPTAVAVTDTSQYVTEEGVQALMALGFLREQCAAALAAAVGNRDLAYEFLLGAVGGAATCEEAPAAAVGPLKLELPPSSQQGPPPAPPPPTAVVAAATSGGPTATSGGPLSTAPPHSPILSEQTAVASSPSSCAAGEGVLAAEKFKTKVAVQNMDMVFS